jgi:trk system potassium uptake protein TrkA
MKFIIIGLGNFGSSIGQKLTAAGHEVIGVDIKMSHVDAMKESISHTVCLDCTDPQAVTHLPLKDVDIVVVCIGEDEGANIMSTALMKRMQVKRLISRAVSPLHENVLEAMGVDEIVHPEEETANRWAKKLSIQGVVDYFELSEEFSIIEAVVPPKFDGKTILELELKKRFNVLVLTTIVRVEEKNLLGITKPVSRVQDVAAADTVLHEGDIMVIYGNLKNIKRFLELKE